MKGVLTSITSQHKKGKTLVSMWYRGEDKARHQLRMYGEPYIYTRNSDAEKLIKWINSNTANKKRWNNRIRIRGQKSDGTIVNSKVHYYLPFDGAGSLTRIDMLERSTDARIVRDRIHTLGGKTYEADIRYVNRFLVDSGIRMGIEHDEQTGRVIPSDYYIEPRYWIIDVESLVYYQGKINTRGPEPIIVIGVYDSYEKRYYIFYVGAEGQLTREKNAVYIPCASEKVVIDSFMSLMQKKNPDILTGYNLKGYDIPKIVHRAKALGLNPRILSPIRWVDVDERIFIGGREILDVYDFAKFLYGKELEEHSLDYVNKELGAGTGKIDSGPINQTWMTDHWAILRYNKRDLDCVLEIFLEQDLLAYLSSIRQLTGVASYADILSKSTLFDVYIMRYYKSKAPPLVVLPTKQEQEKKSYVGGYVMDAVKGVYHNVIVLDFSSLYPNAFITYNIGLRTLQKGTPTDNDIVLTDIAEMNVKQGVFLNGELTVLKNAPAVKTITYRFHTAIDSFVNEIVQDLLKKRAETKKLIREAKTDEEVEVYTRQDAAYKTIVNSAYGVLGLNTFRLYRPETGEAVCIGGRLALKYAIGKARELGYNVIYGDTDSIFIELGKNFNGDPLETGKNLARTITESFHQDAPKLFGPIKRNTIVMDMETVYETVTLWSKKKYLGKIWWQKGQYRTSYNWMGMAGKRSDTSPILEEIQEVLGKSMADNKDTQHRMDYLKELERRIADDEISLWDYSAPQQITKEFHQYKSSPQHVTAAQYANRYFDMSFGRRDKPRIVSVLPPPYGSKYPYVRCIAFTSETIIPDEFKPDKGEIVASLIQPMIDRLLDAVDESYTMQVHKLKIQTNKKGDTFPPRGTYQYLANEKVTVTPYPFEGHSIKHIKVNGVKQDIDKPLELTMDQEYRVSINFKKDKDTK